MSNVNRIFLIGRLTGDPELKTTTGGGSLAKFSLAVDRVSRSDGAKAVDFIPIIAWDNLGEVCGKYLKKGRLVYLAGRIQVRKYMTTEQETRYVTEIIASDMKMLESKALSASSAPTDEQAIAGPSPDYASENDELLSEDDGLVTVKDDIPF